MSQEKVDKYKESKVNRKVEVRKKKQQKLLRYIIEIVVVVLIVFWLGISIHNRNEAAKPRASVEADITAVMDFENEVNTPEE